LTKVSTVATAAMAVWHVGRHPESHKQVCSVTIVALFSVSEAEKKGVVAMMLRVRLCSSDFDL
jgi:hypothetical protein